MYIAPKLVTNQVYNILINDWDEEISGLFIAEGSRWILLHDNQSDFLVDGLRFVHKMNIDEIIEDEETDFKNRVFQKKYPSFPTNENYNLDSSELLLKQLQEKTPLLHFDMDDAEEIVVGKITSVSQDTFTFSTLNQQAEWEGASEVVISDLSSIAIANDYLASLSLLL